MLSYNFSNYGKRIPKDEKQDYTFESFVDFSSILKVALEIYPQQVSKAIDAYNNCSVPMQVEIIFSIVDMVHRFHCGFDVVQDDEKAQDAIDALDVL